MPPTPTFLVPRYWTPEQHYANWKQFDGFARSQEPQYRRNTEQQIDDDLSVLTALLVTLLEEDDRDGSVQLSSARRFLDRAEVLLNNQQTDRWFRRFRLLNERHARSVINLISDEMGEPVGQLWGQNLVQAAQDRANLLAGNVTDTTFDGIRWKMVLGQEEGWDINRQTREVREVLDQGLVVRDDDGNVIRVMGKTERARLVARTESAAMTNRASLLGIQNSGDDRWKNWLSQRDDRVRATHLAEDIDSEPNGIPLGDVFPNTGMSYPHAINERCFLIYPKAPDTE